MPKSDDATVLREFTDYIIAFVEQPRPEFGNLPVCPFARKARLTGRMLLTVTVLSPEAIEACLRAYDRQPHLELIICISPDKHRPSCDEVYRMAEALNRTLPERNLLALAGHPEDPFNIDGLHTRREPYPNIQVLRADVADKAFRLIENSGYYDHWTEDNFRNLVPGMTF